MMRLVTPSSIEQAIAVTSDLQRYRQTARVQSHSADERRNDFLSWCDNHARPHFRNLFARGEGLHAELNGSYDRIATTPVMTERQLNGLLYREFGLWDDRLEQLRAELVACQRFTGRPGSLVVLDTSALMEGPPVTTFDWHKLNTSIAEGLVRLILPILVIEELDDLKRDRDGRRKQKARAVLTTLWDLHGPKPSEPVLLPDQPEVTIEVLADGDWHNRHPNNDVEIIDQALMVTELTGKPVIVASADYAQLYRAGIAGLDAALMPRPD